MTEPERLFEAGTPLERSILGFGRDDAPPDDLAQRTLASIAAVPAACASPAPRPSTHAWPRWIVVGACAVGLAAVVAGVAGGQDRVRALPAAAAPVPVRSPATSAEPEPEPADAKKSDAVVTPDSLPSAPARPATPRAPSPGARAATSPAEPPPASSASIPPPASSASIPPPASSASIAREVELLDAVKAKLGAGDASGAARTLDAYDGEFPRGTLRPEATVLRIRALLARGDREAAVALGDEFLASHATGVHAKRVRSLLEDRREPARASGRDPRQK